MIRPQIGSVISLYDPSSAMFRSQSIWSVMGYVPFSVYMIRPQLCSVLSLYDPSSAIFRSQSIWSVPGYVPFSVDMIRPQLCSVLSLYDPSITYSEYTFVGLVSCNKQKSSFLANCIRILASNTLFYIIKIVVSCYVNNDNIMLLQGGVRGVFA